MSDERHPPVCTAEAIRAAYRPGLRIVWEEAGAREIWEVVAVDETSATTRVTAADGTTRQHAATFEELSQHSAFPVGPTTFTREHFTTPAGSFHGTHCAVATPDGTQHFYFSDHHPGPPLLIVGGQVVRQQVDRSD